MPSMYIPKSANHGLYFLTFTVKNWYYVLDRHDRWEILADSLKFCQENKNLQINEFVFMLNHIHLIVGEQDVSGFIRDFKRFTSSKIRKNIQETEPPVETLFLDDNGMFEFWRRQSVPKSIESEKFYLQKAAYIRDNPVRKKYVMREEDW